jgi:hypothetical protein
MAVVKHVSSEERALANAIYGEVMQPKIGIDGHVYNSILPSREPPQFTGTNFKIPKALSRANKALQRPIYSPNHRRGYIELWRR